MDPRRRHRRRRHRNAVRRRGPGGPGHGHDAAPRDLGSTPGNWIGRSQYAGDPYLRGAVDSLRIYSRALTAAEIADLHSTGL
ncbi:LamG-like jellyroll fold domain-containing protein [Microbispora sp. GKU 823]|uniref:LamG-like jellyroll fold domain-containing protein n=1 Tax=Microbispora sp. GKU 823 TaxID=1652100 RepID=UPI0009D20353|nr:hypothetical protein B1L11_01065 [Microbispora sp. GKU 823]